MARHGYTTADDADACTCDICTGTRGVFSAVAANFDPLPSPPVDPYDRVRGLVGALPPRKARRMILALLIVAFLCTLIELITARGKSLLTWGLLCLCIALLYPHFPGLR